MGAITSIIIILTGILLLHLLEEIKMGFRKKLPFGEMPKPIFIGINIFIYIFCFTTFYLSLVGSELAVPFAWVFTAGMLINSLGHIGIMIVKRAYFPGGFTSFFLLPVSILLGVELLSR